MQREAAWAGGSVDCGTFLAALSASERLFRRPARSRLVSSAGLPLLPPPLPFQNTTGFDQDYVAGLDAFDYYLRMLLEVTLRKPPSARPVYPCAWRPRSIGSSGRASRPHACRACPAAAPATPAVGLGRTPLLRVNYADAAVVAALPHACSCCPCLPMVPDKPRLCMPVTPESTASKLRRLRRRSAALLIRHSMQLDYIDAAFKATLIRAGPTTRPSTYLED